jgi:hypothetical protein
MRHLIPVYHLARKGLTPSGDATFICYADLSMGRDLFSGRYRWKGDADKATAFIDADFADFMAGEVSKAEGFKVETVITGFVERA